MKIKIFLILTLLFSFNTLKAEQPKLRIISMAPALTEIIFALGKGDLLVGNTSFCNYPEEAKKIPRIGGYVDVNLEVVINKKPDRIFIYKENYHKIKIMEKRTRVIQLSHTTLADVYDSIVTIAGELNVPARGKALVASITRKLETIRLKAKGKKKPKVMLVISRNPNKLTNMYIIGKKDFLNQLIDIAGGINAYEGEINYPSISIESIVAMNPDVIFELSAHNEGITEERIHQLWKQYAFIKAVRNEKIIIIKNSLWLIPGPRVGEIAENMHGVFHFLKD